jgi:hypothetical protein
MDKDKTPKDDEELDFFNSIQFPIVRQVQATSLADSLTSYTAEEAREEMARMFERIKEMTGCTPVVDISTNNPINVLVPKKYKRKKK